MSDKGGDHDNSLGRRIKQRRKMLGLNLEQAGALCDLSFTTLSRLENGHHKPNRRTRQKLARLGITVQEHEMHSSKVALEGRVAELEEQVRALTEIVRSLLWTDGPNGPPRPAN